MSIRLRLRFTDDASEAYTPCMEPKSQLAVSAQYVVELIDRYACTNDENECVGTKGHTVHRTILALQVHQSGRGSLGSPSRLAATK